MSLQYSKKRLCSNGYGVGNTPDIRMEVSAKLSILFLWLSPKPPGLEPRCVSRPGSWHEIKDQMYQFSNHHLVIITEVIFIKFTSPVD